MAVLNLAPIKCAQAQGTFPRRGGGKLSGTCIVHTSEGNWANGVNALTNLIATRADYGSYHRAVDWEDIAVYYDWEWEAWQDTETNPWAVGISAACKTSDWGKDYFTANGVEEGYYRNLARCAADFIIYMSSAKGIAVPIRHISGAEARRGVPGFTGHGESGIGRSDPGANFNWERFFAYIEDELNGTPANPSVEDDMFTDEDRKLLKETRDRALGGIPDLPARPKTKILDSADGGFIVQRIDSVGGVVQSLVGAIAAINKGESFDQQKLLNSIEERVAKAVRENAVQVDVSVTDKAKA